MFARSLKAASTLKIGWIGLGQMGQSHVLNLLNKGFDVAVWNRDSTKCEPATQAGAVAATTPSEVVAACDVTFVMLSNAAAALDVYQRSDGVLAGLSVGKGVVDCASIDAGTMRQLSDLVQGKGGRFCAAPVAGHSGMARDATCQFICAGNEELFGTIGDALDAMSKTKFFVGQDVGAASQHKIVLNGLLAKITASTAEALAQAKATGLDQTAFMEVVGGHAMNSPLLQLCAKMMITGEHTPLFMLQHMEKDARLAHELAQAVGQRNPVTAATLEAYATAKQPGTWNEQNWTAIYESFATTQSASNNHDHATHAASYRPMCSEDVFKNHACAFAEQDVDKIMLDYTDESVFSGFDHATGEPFEKRGRTEIRDMFSGFWSAIGEWKGFQSVHEYCTNEPAVRSGFLVWAAPGNGILQATDTFVYDENFKIIRQTFVGGQPPQA